MKTEPLIIHQKNNFIEIFENLLERAVALDADEIRFGENGESSIAFIKDSAACETLTIDDEKSLERIIVVAQLHAGLTPQGKSADMMVNVRDAVAENLKPEIDGNKLFRRSEDGKSLNFTQRTKLSGIFSHPKISGIVFQGERPAGTDQARHNIYLWRSE